jgi:hypothetical protein
MKRTAVWGVLAMIASVGGGAPVVAQAVRLGVVMDLPRKQLAESWDDVNPRQVERAYCVVDWSYGVYHVSRGTPAQDDTIFRVFAIKDADVQNQTPVSADFQCPGGIPELHVHTPTTCMGDDVETCKLGGLNAYSCQPSRGDYEKLVERGDEFGVIQCDKRSFRFYYPSDYMTPAMAALVAAKRKAGNLTAAMKAAQGGP